MKTSFVLYHDIRHPLELLTDEQRGKLFLAILDYSEYGVIPEFQDGALSMAFAFIKNSIDRDAEAWEKKSQSRAEAGKIGGTRTQEKRREAKQNEAKQANASFVKQIKQSQANQAVPVPVPDPVPVLDPVIINNGDAVASAPHKRKKFIPPSVDEIREYCNERNNGIDPEAFSDHYESNGWRVGRNNSPMKDWRATVRTWERNKNDRKANNTDRSYTDNSSGGLGSIRITEL